MVGDQDLFINIETEEDLLARKAHLDDLLDSGRDVREILEDVFPTNLMFSGPPLDENIFNHYVFKRNLFLCKIFVVGDFSNVEPHLDYRAHIYELTAQSRKNNLEFKSYSLEKIIQKVIDTNDNKNLFFAIDNYFDILLDYTIFDRIDKSFLDEVIKVSLPLLKDFLLTKQGVMSAYRALQGIQVDAIVDAQKKHAKDSVVLKKDRGGMLYHPFVEYVLGLAVENGDKAVLKMVADTYSEVSEQEDISSPPFDDIGILARTFYTLAERAREDSSPKSDERDKKGLFSGLREKIGAHLRKKNRAILPQETEKGYGHIKYLLERADRSEYPDEKINLIMNIFKNDIMPSILHLDYQAPAIFSKDAKNVYDFEKRMLIICNNTLKEKFDRNVAWNLLNFLSEKYILPFKYKTSGELGTVLDSLFETSIENNYFDLALYLDAYFCLGKEETMFKKAKEMMKNMQKKSEWAHSDDGVIDSTIYTYGLPCSLNDLEVSDCGIDDLIEALCRNEHFSVARSVLTYLECIQKLWADLNEGKEISGRYSTYLCECFSKKTTPEGNVIIIEPTPMDYLMELVTVERIAKGHSLRIPSDINEKRFRSGVMAAQAEHREEALHFFKECDFDLLEDYINGVFYQVMSNIILTEIYIKGNQSGVKETINKELLNTNKDIVERVDVKSDSVQIHFNGGFVYEYSHHLTGEKDQRNIVEIFYQIKPETDIRYVTKFYHDLMMGESEDSLYTYYRALKEKKGLDLSQFNAQFPRQVFYKKIRDKAIMQLEVLNGVPLTAIVGGLESKEKEEILRRAMKIDNYLYSARISEYEQNLELLLKRLGIPVYLTEEYCDKRFSEFIDQSKSMGRLDLAESLEDSKELIIKEITKPGEHFVHNDYGIRNLMINPDSKTLMPIDHEVYFLMHPMAAKVALLKHPLLFNDKEQNIYQALKEESLICLSESGCPETEEDMGRLWNKWAVFWDIRQALWIGRMMLNNSSTEKDNQHYERYISDISHELDGIN